YDRHTAPLSLKILRLEAEVVEALLCGRGTWTLWPEDFDGLRTAHHESLLGVVVFCRKDGTSHKTLSYSAVVEITDCERIETIIRRCQPWLAGALARQDQTCLPKRVMHGRI
ncbi:unnamed protein product, partial [Sphacelaria rigidula]